MPDLEETIDCTSDEMNERPFSISGERRLWMHVVLHAIQDMDLMKNRARGLLKRLDNPTHCLIILDAITQFLNEIDHYIFAEACDLAGVSISKVRSKIHKTLDPFLELEKDKKVQQWRINREKENIRETNHGR